MLNRALKVLRTYHQLSQRELADELKISYSYLCEIEKGIKSPSIQLLEQYSVIFKMPVSNILLFSEKMGKNSNGEKVRISAANKVLRLLEWLSETDNVSINA